MKMKIRGGSVQGNYMISWKNLFTNCLFILLGFPLCDIDKDVLWDVALIEVPT